MHTHTHISCLIRFLVCCVCVVFMCSLMFINISSCMLYMIAFCMTKVMFILDLGLHSLCWALYEQRPYKRCTDLIDLNRSLYRRCIKRCTYSATLFSREIKVWALYKRRSTYNAQGKNRATYQNAPLWF